MKTATQQGFTLIELIMVIVIIGILAAVALPRFGNMQADARRATLEGMLGAVNSAIAIVHSQALVSNQLGDPGSINLETGAVVTRFGYPAATAAGIQAALTVSPTGYVFTPVAGGATLTIDVAGATNEATCRITYTAATAANVPARAEILAGNTAGC